MPRKFSPTITLLILLCLSLSVRSQVAVTASMGTPNGSYPTLKATFDAINAGTHNGDISIMVGGNITETSPAVLNASGSGSSFYSSVIIRPVATATITGNISNGPLIRLNGSNNVTINGSISATTTRDLTIQNTSTTSSNVLVVGSSGTTPINNVTVKNTILINGANTTTAMIIGDAAVPGNPGYFSNITIQNNNIRKAYIGIYAYAVVSALLNNLDLLENDINSTGADAIRLVGIYGQGVNGMNIRDNNIGNFEGSSAEFDRAIWLATATKNATISGNTISGLQYTGTSSYAPIGINLSSGITNANIVTENNTITDLSSSGTGNTMGMFLYSAMSRLTVRNNRVSNIRNTNTAGYGAAGIMLAPTINTADTRVHNNFVWAVSAYGFNGSDASDNANGIVVDGGGGISIDFNTVSMNANATLTGAHRSSAMLVTTNVTAPGAVSIRNNIFANLQTTGNANAAPAMNIAAATSVLGTVDYNVYYSTKGNLLCRGTTNSTTLADLQTALGGNANSLNIQPVFVGANDLHLDPDNNDLLDGQAIPIAGIAADLDGDIRSTTTPDPGADEFLVCPLVTVTDQPDPVTTCQNTNTSFSVTATGATTYQWQVDDNTGGGFVNITNNAVYSNATTATLNITNVPASYTGYNYRCVAGSGIAGCTPANSNAAVLTLRLNPSVTLHPAPLSLPHGDAGSFTITATGATPVTYQWQVSTAGPGGPYNDLTNDGTYDDVTTATLKILSADIAMNGYQYRCVAGNTCASAIYSNPAELTVTQLSQSLTFAAQTDGGTRTRTYGDPDLNGIAYSSAPLMVTYTSSDPAVAVVDPAGQVTITGAGTATITASQAGDAVYLPAADISFTIVVNKLAITVYANAQSKTYGDYDPSFSYTVSPSLIGTDVFTGSPDRAAGEGVGSYAIEQSTLTAGNNYDMTFYGNNMDITPRELYVTADDQIRDYGAPNPTFTLTYSNFGFTDDATVITTPITASSIANNTSIPGDYPITLNGGGATNYTFIFTDGKLTIRPVQLQVNQQPNAATICADERASFSTAVTVTPGVAPVDYQWQYSVDGINGWQDLSQGSSSTYNTRAGSSTGFVRCKFSVPGADHYSDPAPLNINALPVIRANKSNDIDCAASSARLLATGGVSYQWAPATGLDNPSIANPVTTPDRSTTYLVTGTDANGCKNTARILVTVIPSEYNVPNAFTPNNDGKNDCWGVRHWQKVTEFSVTIMNRNGQPVYQSKDVSKCWDGYFRGEQQPTGSYVYYIRCISPCGVIERKGTFVLIR